MVLILPQTPHVRRVGRNTVYLRFDVVLNIMLVCMELVIRLRRTQALCAPSNHRCLTMWASFIPGRSLYAIIATASSAWTSLIWLVNSTGSGGADISLFLR